MTFVNFHKIEKEILYAIENNLSLSTYANGNNYFRKGEKMLENSDWPNYTYTLNQNGLTFIIGSASTNPQKSSKPKVHKDLIPERIIVNKRTTIVYFPDGDKVLVRCAENEEFQIETAVAEAITKKVFGGNRSAFLKVVDQTYYQPDNNEKKSDNIE